MMAQTWMHRQIAAPESEHDYTFCDRMQSYSLDDNPILIQFRRVMDSISKKSDRFYYLLLPPPYAYRNGRYDPLKYFFYNDPMNPSVVRCFNNESVSIEINDGQTIKPLSGFSQRFIIQILLNTPCTTSKELSFLMYELDNDPYNIVEIPAFCNRVFECASDHVKSQLFLEKELQNKQLATLLKTINQAICLTSISVENREDFVQRLHVSIGDVAQCVFTSPHVQQLPVAGKRKLNYLIYNAITAKCHFQLLRAYNAAYAPENSACQIAMRSRKFESDNHEAMEQAAKHLHNVLQAKSPLLAIGAVCNFFDAVVAALHVTDVAADDILPAICVAMSKNVEFDSHVYSFFTYLVDVWPQQGLDERTSYVLITCSIAASHLTMIQDASTPPPQPAANTSTNSTIEMLEDLLNL